MGWFEDIFGSKQQTQNQQSGTSTTQNNAWSQIQPFMQQYLQQYSAGNIANAQVAPNALTSAAGANQQTTTANLAPGYQAAGNIATNGITPSSIQGFMSPYVQNVVDATRNDFNTQNARANAGVQAQASKLGALTGSQGAVAKNLAMESQRRQQDPIIAGLYNQGYSQATNTAAQSAGLQNQAAGTLGSLTNAQTAANAGLSGIGQQQTANQWQNVLSPYQLTSQGASGLPSLYGAAGQNTQSTGASSGNTTSTNSPWNIGTNILGGAMSFFKDGGRVERADGGAVGDLKPFHADGGEAFHDKVEKAFHVLNRMKSFSKGGVIEPYHAKPHYDGGGVVPYGDWGSPAPNGSEDGPPPMPARFDPSWGTMVEREPQKAPLADFKTWLAGQNGHAQQPQTPPKTAPIDDPGAKLAAFIQGMQPRGYADGGMPEWGPGSETPSFPVAPYASPSAEPPSYVGAAEREPAAGPEKSWMQSFKDFVGSRKGAIAGEDLTPMNRAGMIVAGMGIGPVGPGKVGETVMGLEENRLKKLQAARDAERIGLERAQMLGEYNGRPTLHAQQFAETQWKNRLPEFRQIGQTEDGIPMYGWTNPSEAARTLRPAPPSAGAPPPSAEPTAPPVARPAPERGGVVGPSERSTPGAPARSTPGVTPVAGYGTPEVTEETTGLSGEPFLEWLEKNGQKPRADMLRAISEGRERFPENPRSPQERALRRQAMQYDPTLDATTYQVRAATRKDWNAGPTSKNIAAINTAARHAADLYGAVDNLGTSDIPLGSWARAALNPVLGAYNPEYKAKLNTFENKKLALAEELSKAFHGGPSVSGVDEWKKQFQAADSPQALRASVAAAVKLLEGRMEELDSNYFRAMGKPPPRETLSGKAKEEYDLIKRAAALNIPISELREKEKKEGARPPPPSRSPVSPASGPPAPPASPERTERGGPPGSATNPIYPRTPQAAAELPSGTFFYTPDGRLKVVP